MKKLRAFLVILPAVGIGGCLFTSGVRDSDLAALESRIQSINQRIDQLEAARTVGGATVGSATLGFSAVGTPAAFDAAGTAAAAAPAARGGWWPAFSWRGAANKLARGLTNVVTGWVEIPKRVNETTNQSGALSGFTWGLARGLGHGFVRTIGGGYETITFPFPAPPGYQPIIQPPYVFSCQADAYPPNTPVN